MSIDSRELRIGNKVYYGNEKVIFTVTTDFLYFEKNNNEPCRPIPLTDEILEKCGFTQNDNRYINILRNGFYVQLIYDERVLKTGYFVPVHNFLPTPIHYLHQLQNLYYALTQTELEINL